MDTRILMLLCCLPLLIDATSRSAPQLKSMTRRQDRLRTLLQEYFSETRHPLRNEDSWLYARQGIAATVRDILLSHPNAKTAIVDTQLFETEVLDESMTRVPIKGENIIVTFSRSNQATSSDEILLIGAHYDSDFTTLGINDNGSGSAALLEIIFNLAETLESKKFVIKNTIIFVFFDVQNMEHILVTDGLRSGSQFYVEEILGDVLSSSPRSAFRGAIILDAILNYNTTATSQSLPVGFNMSFPEAFQSISANNYTGNFLGLVSKEIARTFRLENYLIQKWNEVDTQKKYPLLNLEVGRKQPTPATYEFFKQDHRPFWSYILENTSSPLPAVLLTDTGKYRNMPRQCSSKPCDISEILNDAHFSFMDQTISTINRLIAETQLEALTSPTSKPDNNGGHHIALNIAPLLFSLFIALLMYQ